MPKIDVAAKAWQKDMAERVGRAVQTRRRELKMTAAALAKRCAELGYPISRVAIGKIESNHREGKFDLAELVTLSAALDTAPIALLYPSPHRKEVRLTPHWEMPEVWAAQWFSGLIYGLSDVPYSAMTRPATVTAPAVIAPGAASLSLTGSAPNVTAYNRSLRQLRRARQRLELEERRNTLRRNLAKQRDPELVSQMVDEVADLQRRIDEIDAEVDRLVAENSGGTQ
jgi:transcriptional regulator with XRE-family HTH domain